MSSGATQTSRIEAALSAPLADLDLDLEAVELAPVGTRRVLRIAIDKDDGITDLDVVAASREVGRLLDESDLMGEQPYTLEVTSRGVDRALTLPRHWRRNVGRLVKVKVADGSSVTGRIGAFDEEPDGGVALDVSGQERRIEYADVTRALVQIEFNRPTPGEEESD